MQMMKSPPGGALGFLICSTWVCIRGVNCDYDLHNIHKLRCSSSFGNIDMLWVSYALWNMRHVHKFLSRTYIYRRLGRAYIG